MKKQGIINGVFFGVMFLVGCFTTNINAAFGVVSLLLIAQLGYNIVKLKRMG